MWLYWVGNSITYSITAFMHIHQGRPRWKPPKIYFILVKDNLLSSVTPYDSGMIINSSNLLQHGIAHI